VPDAPAPNSSHLTDSFSSGLPPRELAALVHLDQARRWARGECLSVDAYLEKHPALRADPEALLDLLCNEIILRQQHGDSPDLDDYLARFPEVAQTAEAEANTQKEAAQEAARQAQRQLANSQVLLADATWREGHARLAREHLDAVPADLRRWEWRYLKRVTTGGLFTLYGHSGPVLSVSFSPDGRRLATGSGDNTAKVWDARTGQELPTIQGHTGAIAGLCFSPDGKRLATASNDHTAKVWDIGTGRQLFTLLGHEGEVNTLATARRERHARQGG
jgi:hypothetical protein